MDRMKSKRIDRDCTVMMDIPFRYKPAAFISVQASSFHYCKPRLNGIQDYESVELGFPSTEDELINEYAEDDSDYTKTVYGYVPIEIIEELVNKHGGIKA